MYSDCGKLVTILCGRQPCEAGTVLIPFYSCGPGRQGLGVGWAADSSLRIQGPSASVELGRRGGKVGGKWTSTITPSPLSPEGSVWAVLWRPQSPPGWGGGPKEETSPARHCLPPGSESEVASHGQSLGLTTSVTDSTESPGVPCVPALCWGLDMRQGTRTEPLPSWG